jgi:5-methylthioadenosine/S-adenosylhomocysteine deaminase
VIRYVADTVLTCDADRRVLSPGVVEVVDGTITRVAEVETVALSVAGTGPQTTAGGVDEVRLPGLLMPGLVNAHCHSPMTLLRGAGEGLPLMRWLTEVVWPREARLTGEDVYWGMTLACAEMLRNGITTACEMYFFPEETASAVDAAGMRAVMTPGIILAPGFEALGTWQEQLERVSEFHEVHDGSAGGRITAGLAAHAAYTLPLEAMVATASRAAELGTIFHTHLAETRSEGAAIEERFGASVPAVLADHGVFEPDVVAAHCVWLDHADMALLAHHGVSVAHCPQSNAKLGSGIASIARLREQGVNVALGTDGPASNNNLDLWEEIRLALLLASVLPALGGTGDAVDGGGLEGSTGRAGGPGDGHRVQSVPPPLGPADALELATRNGAAALGLGNVGSIEVGRQADMVLVDTTDPAFTPVTERADLVSHLAWSGDARAVTDVWVAGRKVVADRRCITVDVEQARREVQARAVDLASR